MSLPLVSKRSMKMSEVARLFGRSPDTIKRHTLRGTLPNLGWRDPLGTGRWVAEREKVIAFWERCGRDFQRMLSS